MLKKKLTFMVIPDSTGTPRELKLPVWLLVSTVGIALVVTFSSMFFASEYFGDRVTSVQVDNLLQENTDLQNKFDKLSWDLAQADTRFDKLVAKEVAIRVMFDLPPINEDERLLGIGGPGQPDLARMSAAQQKAYETEIEVDRLLRLSKFELEKFGEIEIELSNLQDRLNHTPSIWPSRGWNSRGFGMKHDPFTGYKQLHRGIDIANHRGTPIIATADGKVKTVGTFGSLGKLIVLDHGYGFISRYGHLQKWAVKRGQRVKRGDVIGYMGNTGYSTGPHLHYEVWRNGKALNPRDYILNTK